MNERRCECLSEYLSKFVKRSYTQAKMLGNLLVHVVIIVFVAASYVCYLNDTEGFLFFCCITFRQSTKWA